MGCGGTASGPATASTGPSDVHVVPPSSVSSISTSHGAAGLFDAETGHVPAMAQAFRPMALTSYTYGLMGEACCQVTPSFLVTHNGIPDPLRAPHR